VLIIADLSKCIGAGQCVTFAPRCFTQDENTGLVVVGNDVRDEDSRSSVEAAVLACPSGALRIEG
jgi:ferredoxin